MPNELPFDENVFFRNATLRLCGDLEIDKALRSCLLYVRQYIPADFMGFVIYLPDQVAFETVAFANLNGSDKLSVKIMVDDEYRAYLEEDFSQPRITIAEPNNPNDPTNKMIDRLEWPAGPAITIEMVLAGKRMGALVMIAAQPVRYTQEHVRRLAMLNEPLGIALTNSLRYRKVQELKNLLLDDKRYLEDELNQVTGQKIVGSDYGLKGVMEAVGQVAPLSSPVLLLGETGVGKELVAKAVHNHSPRRTGPFIKVNCGAITDTLIDSELFGHEKGAFTGALFLKRGRFERAAGGTIFLDEIGELPLDAQIRLLRVLQDREIERVGSETSISVDCRVIAATHRDLHQMIEDGKFREDLYFRLKVFPIAIPPLRERKEDIPALVQHFMQKKAKEIALQGIPTLSPQALARLMAYDWPGNVRELENAVERALIMNRNSPLPFDDLGMTAKQSESFALSCQESGFACLDDIIADHIKAALFRSQGRIEGPLGAARLLGVHPATLRQKMRKLKIPFGRRAGQQYRKDQNMV